MRKALQRVAMLGLIGLAAPTLAAAQPAPSKPQAEDAMQIGAAPANSLLPDSPGAAASAEAAQKAGLRCAVSEGKLLGANPTATFYEVACGQGSLGYIVQSGPGEASSVYDCLTLKTGYDKAVAENTARGNTCTLPGNADPQSGLMNWLTQAGMPCTAVTKGVWRGRNQPSNINVYEALCTNKGDYIILAPNPGSLKALVAVPCARATTVGVTCQLTSAKELERQIIALSGPADRPGCSPARGRWVVTDPATNDDYYELGCSDGKTAYMIRADLGGRFKAALDCVQAARIAGGCTYMDIGRGSAGDAAGYTRLATQIGYDACAGVTSFQSHGPEPHGRRELVELACGAGEGGYAMMPTAAGQTGEFFNCARARGRGLTCRLTAPQITYAKLSQQIAAYGVTCAVDNARDIGKDAQGQDYMEVACGSQPGMVLTYSASPREALLGAVPCALSPVPNGCQLKK